MLDARGHVSNHKLPADVPPVLDASDYRSFTGALQYLTITRLDIADAVQQVCLHMHDPQEPHLCRCASCPVGVKVVWILCRG